MKLQLIGIGLAFAIMAGCSAAVGTEAAGNGEVPDDLPKAPAGIYRVMSMKNATLIGKGADSCMPERPVKELMSYDFGETSCSDQVFEVLSNGWKQQAKCEHRNGPQTVTIKLTGGLNSTFTVEKTRTYDAPRNGRMSDTFTHRWEYRGQC